MSRVARALACLPPAFIAACGGGVGGGGGTPVTIALTATAETPAQVTLAWTAPADQTQFDLYRDGTAVYPTHIGGRSVTEFTLQPGARYCYTLNAVQFPVGVVGTSNTACTTTPPLAGWPIDVIDTTAPQVVALALDNAGAAHVGMRAGTSIVHLTNASGAWVRSVVDGAGGNAGAVAIAVDAARAAHLGWYDAGRGTLKYATNAAGAWSTTEIGIGGVHNAVALDAAGRVHLAYSGDPAAGAPLMHAVNSGSGWSGEFVAAGAVQRVSLATDAADRLHVGFASGDGLNCALWHASEASVTWTAVPIATATQCTAALAIGRSGTLHAAYMMSGPLFALVHASDAGGIWSAAPIDTFHWIPGSSLSIALDAAGRVHLSYIDHSGLLKYATEAGGAWTRAWVDVGARDSALQVASDGRARIAYVGATGSSTVLRWTRGP